MSQDASLISIQQPQQSHRASSRKARVYVFREFLMDKYGDILRENDIVLDVAGGKGDLSWILANVDGIRSVIVDPQIFSHKHLLRSVVYLRENPSVLSERAIPGLPTYQPLAALMHQLPSMRDLQTPLHLRLLVNDKLVESVKSYLETGSVVAWKRFWEDATCKQGAYLSNEKERTVERNDQFPTNLSLDAEYVLKEIFLKARLLVGFHPDQATEPILDLGALLQIPFAVVPCCVFPAEFPHRLTAQGARVRTYSQFIEYLVQKWTSSSAAASGAILQQASLHFFFSETAKNIVLFTMHQGTWKNLE